MATFNIEFHDFHMWGGETYEEDGSFQCSIDVTIPVRIVVDNDFDYATATINRDEVIIRAKNGPGRPWDASIDQGYDVYCLGWSPDLAGYHPEHGYYENLHYLDWHGWEDAGGWNPAWPAGTKHPHAEDKGLILNQFKVAFPLTFSENALLLVWFKTTGDIEVQWLSEGPVYERRWKVDDALPDPACVLIQFLRAGSLIEWDEMPDVVPPVPKPPVPSTMFFDEPFLAANLIDADPGNYFPWAIRKKVDGEWIWVSCNRTGQSDPDTRRGQSEIYERGNGWDNCLNSLGKQRDNEGFHYRDGQWVRAPLTGWSSGPDNPWDGTHEYPPDQGPND